MDKTRLKKIVYIIDYLLFGWIMNLSYKQYYRPKYNYQFNFKMLYKYFFYQKILRINGRVEWPVHFTSKIQTPQKISKGFMCDPGDTPGCYIQAINRIEFGSNVEMGAGVKIISSDHLEDDFSVSKLSKPIIIGNNVWIGSNAVILKEVIIGDNVIIGAGSVVTKNIPSNSIAVGNPCKVIREKKPYRKNIFDIKLNREF